ncbi:MAG TPA: NlpC/P60 family peptidoglycan endopeptidase RipA [Mycobacterium sp.]|nr:NlpC/P60 family peptidoglycan endopeptidase RipA [Mycobacterium sp.]
MRPIMRALMTAATTLLLTTNGMAVAGAAHDVAGGDGSEIAELIAEVAEADQQLHDLGAAIQVRQEGVNKAITDVQSARDAAVAAQRELDISQQAVEDANVAIATAQQRFDNFAAGTYVNGPPGSTLVGATPEEVLANASAGQTLALSFQQALADLARTRTDLTNKESAARAAQQKADQAAADSQRSMDTAVTTLTEAQQNFRAQQAEVDRLVVLRNDKQARLDAARTSRHSVTTPAQPTPPASGESWDRATSPAGTSNWDTTLPMVPSANVADPVKIVNSVLQISASSAQVTAELGRKFLAGLGINLGGGAPAAADPGITNSRIPRVYGRQASEFVIRRAMSQIGVPYSWGGGDANGPSRGIDQGANTVGFDCSGLILYAFAGVGIKLPHYSGSQYNAGRKIPSSQMRRGDLIFYGPNASQHEAMYLGNGMMLEAPYTGSQVKVSPVRTSGMTPYVTRLIEY